MNVPLSPRVLIADDDDANREVLSYYLRRQGFEVCTVASGAEAIDALESGTFAMLLLDVVMPEMDGLETLRRIRTRFTPAMLPVILFTGLESDETLHAARALGANGCLPKPYQLSELLEAIRGQLTEPKALR
ncbi:MAG TPA: response regulator [Vicinamibacterales bacterium]